MSTAAAAALAAAAAGTIATTGRRRPGRRQRRAAAPPPPPAADAASRRGDARAAPSPPPRLSPRPRRLGVARSGARRRGSRSVRELLVALRGRAWILALVAGVLITVGWFLPWRSGGSGVPTLDRRVLDRRDQVALAFVLVAGLAVSRGRDCSLERVCSGAARRTLGCSSPSSPRARLGAMVAIRGRRHERGARRRGLACLAPARPS